MDTLRILVQKRQPLLQEAHLSDLVRRHLKGALPQDLWKEIIKAVFKPKDEAMLTASLEELMGQEGSGRSAGEVQYSAFVQVLLRWNLEMHEEALKPILEAFKGVDAQGLGYLQAPEFATFCRAINPAVTDDEVAVLLASLAPGPLKQVTFSSCAFVLGAELSRMLGYL
eukprot:jgi/Botrbrau1/4111/Bobra.152_3s0058.1